MKLWRKKMEKVSLLLLFMSVWITTAKADCYNIKNYDDKYYCLALTKQEIHQCYNIKNSDKKYYCLAKLDNNLQCYNIKDKNLKQLCFANS